LRLFRILGQNNRTNPVALLKEAMKMLGYNAGIPRLPLSPGTAEEIANVKNVMQELSII
jgi:4-hydroxy-tetrahydrodipicolinate synthase